MSLRSILSLALVLGLLGLLAGCGDDDGGGDNNNENARTTPARTTATTSSTTGPTGPTGRSGSTGPSGPTGTSTAAPSPTAEPDEELDAVDEGSTETDDTTTAAGDGDDPLDGVTFFSPESPWNTRVDNLSIDRNSTRMLSQAKIRPAAVDSRDGGIRIVPRTIPDGAVVNIDKFTTPVWTNRDGGRVSIVCRQQFCGPDADITEIEVPDRAAPDPRYDGWFTAIDLEERVAVDLWRGRREGDVISYQYIRRWDLDGSGFGPPIEQDANRAYSARGSGLPLFAGMIYPWELRRGRINHALAISLPAPARFKYVQPASVTDGQGNADSVPEGARLRLRDDAEVDDAFNASEEDPDEIQLDEKIFDVELSELGLLPREREELHARARRVILRALREYGAIVVDRSAVPTMYAQLNGDFRGLLNGDEVRQVDLEDFEVVQLPQVFDDPPPDQIVDPQFEDEQRQSEQEEQEALDAIAEGEDTFDEDFLSGGDEAGGGEFAP